VEYRLTRKRESDGHFLDLAVTGHVEAESSQDPAQPPLQLSQSPPISCSSRRQISDEVQTDQTEMHNFNSNFFFESNSLIFNHNSTSEDMLIFIKWKGMLTDTSQSLTFIKDKQCQDPTPTHITNYLNTIYLYITIICTFIHTICIPYFKRGRKGWKDYQYFLPSTCVLIKYSILHYSPII